MSYATSCRSGTTTPSETNRRVFGPSTAFNTVRSLRRAANVCSESAMLLAAIPRACASTSVRQTMSWKPVTPAHSRCTTMSSCPPVPRLISRASASEMLMLPNCSRS